MLQETIELEVVTPERYVLRETVQSLDLPGRTLGVEHLQARRLWHDRVAKHYRELGAADWRAG